MLPIMHISLQGFCIFLTISHALCIRNFSSFYEAHNVPSQFCFSPSFLKMGETPCRIALLYHKRKCLSAEAFQEEGQRRRNYRNTGDGAFRLIAVTNPTPLSSLGIPHWCLIYLCTPETRTSTHFVHLHDTKPIYCLRVLRP